jgi:dTDP-D-glucose 4,6-dehydratase
VTLAQGLRLTVEWYLAHQKWIQHLAARADYGDWINKNYAKRGDRK